MPRESTTLSLMKMTQSGSDVLTAIMLVQNRISIRTVTDCRFKEEAWTWSIYMGFARQMNR